MRSFQHRRTMPDRFSLSTIINSRVFSAKMPNTRRTTISRQTANSFLFPYRAFAVLAQYVIKTFAISACKLPPCRRASVCTAEVAP